VVIEEMFPGGLGGTIKYSIHNHKSMPASGAMMVITMQIPDGGDGGGVVVIVTQNSVWGNRFNFALMEKNAADTRPNHNDATGGGGAGGQLSTNKYYCKYNS
jgi:hypothetical protein